MRAWVRFVEQGNVNDLARRHVVRFETGVEGLAHDTLDRSNSTYVPVRTGELQRSGRTESRRSLEGRTFSVVYDAPHAFLVHSWPGWKGREDPGRPKAGQRYLDRAVLDVLAGAAVKLQLAMVAETLRRASRGPASGHGTRRTNPAGRGQRRRS